jgi:hypothetical protein
LRFEQIAALPQSLLHLRRVQAKLDARIKANNMPTDELCSLAGALVRVIEQRRVMLRMPGPPTGTALSRDQVLKLVRAEPIETEPVASEASAVESAKPTPEIKNPAGDGGVCGDEPDQSGNS